MAEESDATRDKDKNDQPEKLSPTTAPGPQVTSPADAQRFAEQPAEGEGGEQTP